MEIEIKFSPVKPEIGAEILESHKLFTGETFETKMRAVYFDTPQMELRKVGASLRMRRENNKQVCCFKKRIDELRRVEVELETDNFAAGVGRLLSENDIPGEAKEIIRRGGLCPHFGSEYLRRGRYARVGESVIEVVYDSGVLFQENRFCSVSEIELELKSGSSEDLQALAGYLAANYRLTLSKSTKAGRANALTKAAFDALEVFDAKRISKYELYRMFAMGELWYTKDDSGNKTFYKVK